MGGTWRSEDFAGKAVFQLHRLTVDDDLLGPGRGPVARAAIGHVCGRKMERNQGSNKKMLRRKPPQTKWKKLHPSPKKMFYKSEHPMKCRRFFNQDNTRSPYVIISKFLNFPGRGSSRIIGT